MVSQTMQAPGLAMDDQNSETGRMQQHCSFEMKHVRYHSNVCIREWQVRSDCCTLDH